MPLKRTTVYQTCKIAILPLENENSDEEDDGAEEKHQTASAEDQDICNLNRNVLYYDDNYVHVAKKSSQLTVCSMYGCDVY